MWAFNEASLLADLRQFDESIHLLEGLLIGTPESADEDCDLHLQLSFIRTEQGDLPKALVEAQAALRLAAGNGYLRDQRMSARLQLASIRHRQGSPAESEGYLREILREDPVNPTALNNLGYFLVERGERLEEARRMIERATAIEPLNASFLDSLGWVLFKLGQPEPARIQLERALRLAPRSAATHEHLGEVLEALGRRVEARRHWQKALEYAADEPQRSRLKSRLR
jgi:tetratricopeptide (TPR) repeat protein